MPGRLSYTKRLQFAACQRADDGVEGFATFLSSIREGAFCLEASEVLLGRTYSGEARFEPELTVCCSQFVNRMLCERSENSCVKLTGLNVLGLLHQTQQQQVLSPFLRLTAASLQIFTEPMKRPDKT